MKPMKAFRYDKYHSELPESHFVQRKLNGVRMLHQDGYCLSTGDLYWQPKMLSHIKEALNHIPQNYLLDGELYIHGWSLQRINGAASIKSVEPSANTFKLEFHVFDIIDASQPDLPFSSRIQLLQELIPPNLGPVKLVETILVSSKAQGESLFKTFKEEGYEGSMCRHPDKPYGLPWMCGNQDNRWKYILKRKHWSDGEFNIVGFEKTQGENGELGFRLLCETDEGKEFAVSSGLSDMEVLEYARNPPIGSQVKLRYLCLSDYGLPLNATIECML